MAKRQSKRNQMKTNAVPVRESLAVAQAQLAGHLALARELRDAGALFDGPEWAEALSAAKEACQVETEMACYEYRNEVRAQYVDDAP